jgi:hypothetical protein
MLLRISAVCQNKISEAVARFIIDTVAERLQTTIPAAKLHNQSLLPLRVSYAQKLSGII